MSDADDVVSTISFVVILVIVVALTLLVDACFDRSAERYQRGQFRLTEHHVVENETVCRYVRQTDQAVRTIHISKGLSCPKELDTAARRND